VTFYCYKYLSGVSNTTTHQQAAKATTLEERDRNRASSTSIAKQKKTDKKGKKVQKENRQNWEHTPNLRSKEGLKKLTPNMKERLS